MSSGTSPPRCPDRGATLRGHWPVLLLASLVLSTPAPLYSQETQLRIVAPASHMRLWSEDDVVAAPKPVQKSAQTAPASSPAATAFPAPTPRIAANWDEPAARLPSEAVAAPQPDRPAPCRAAPRLSTLSTNIALPAGKLPTGTACTPQLVGDARLAGNWAGSEYHWSATCMRHRPLYFEETNAERYGYTPSYTLQPLLSAAHFFATLPALPYLMMLERPHDCLYTLGHYRPGSCAPRRCRRWPLKLSASAVQTGFVVGLILLLP